MDEADSVLRTGNLLKRCRRPLLVSPENVAGVGPTELGRASVLPEPFDTMELESVARSGLRFSPGRIRLPSYKPPSPSVFALCPAPPLVDLLRLHRACPARVPNVNRSNAVALITGGRIAPPSPNFAKSTRPPVLRLLIFDALPACPDGGSCRRRPALLCVSRHHHSECCVGARQVSGE